MFTPTLVEVPPVIDLREYRKVGVPILDQGQEGACTGFGLATIVNYLLRTRDGFEDKTRAVVRRCLDNGTIVILSTIPPRSGLLDKSRQLVQRLADQLGEGLRAVFAGKDAVRRVPNSGPGHFGQVEARQGVGRFVVVHLFSFKQPWQPLRPRACQLVTSASIPHMVARKSADGAVANLVRSGRKQPQRFRAGSSASTSLHDRFTRPGGRRLVTASEAASMPVPILILQMLAAAQVTPATPNKVTGHAWAPFISPMGEPFRAKTATDDTLKRNKLNWRLSYERQCCTPCRRLSRFAWRCP